jgi:hypothetical protein
MQSNRQNRTLSLGRFLSAAVIAIALVVVAGNFTASQSSGSSVTTCYNKKTGALRYLVKGKCKKSEIVLSINKTGPQGPRGATGPRGLTGSSGYSAGYSATDVFDDQIPATGGTVQLSGSEMKRIFSTKDISVHGASTASSLTVTGTKKVQVSVTLTLGDSNPGVNNTQVNGVGTAICQLFSGSASQPEETFVPMAESFLSVSDIKTSDTPASYEGLKSTMVINGFKEMSGSNAFAVKCGINPYGENPIPDVRVLGYSLNAIAIG